MQTVVDYVFEQLEENSLFFRGTDNELNISISASDYLDLKRLAKAIFEKQIIEAFDEGQEYEYQYHINNAPKFYSETYFVETYGSKGSDETNGNNVEEVPNVANDIFDQQLFNYFSQEFNISLLGTEIQDIIYIVKKHTSSQTEISDEEIQQGIADKWDGYVPSTWFSAFEEGAKWYREQLKSK